MCLCFFHSPLAALWCCKSPPDFLPQPFFNSSSHLSSVLSWALTFLAASYCLQSQGNCLRIASICHILVTSPPPTPHNPTPDCQPYLPFPTTHLLFSGFSKPCCSFTWKVLAYSQWNMIHSWALAWFLYLVLIESNSFSLSFLSKYNNWDSDHCYSDIDICGSLSHVGPSETWCAMQHALAKIIKVWKWKVWAPGQRI